MPTHGPITTEPKCPRCGYDQSGEVATWTDRCPLEGRCTECGRVFEWTVVFDPSRTTLRWSFEHAPGFFGLFPRWFRTIGRATRPGLYWRSIGLAEPVRPFRITVMLLLWWLAVRALWSVPIAAVMKLGINPKTTGLSVWSQLTRGLHLEYSIYLYESAFLGALGRWRYGGRWDTDDTIDVFALSAWPMTLSLLWLMYTAVWYAPSIRARGLARHLIRGLLMSFLLFPLIHESTRIAVGWGYWTQGTVHAGVILAALCGSLVAISYWWSIAVRIVVPEVSIRFFVYGNIAVIFIAPALHFAVVMKIAELLQ